MFSHNFLTFYGKNTFCTILMQKINLNDIFQANLPLTGCGKCDLLKMIIYGVRMSTNPKHLEPNEWVKFFFH